VPFVLFRKKNFIYFIFFAKTCPERDKSGPGGHIVMMLWFPGTTLIRWRSDACATKPPNIIETSSSSSEKFRGTLQLVKKNGTVTVLQLAALTRCPWSGSTYVMVRAEFKMPASLKKKRSTLNNIVVERICILCDPAIRLIFDTW